MKPTRLWVLPVVAVLAAAVVYTLLRLDHSLLVPLSLSAPIAVLIFGAVELQVARVTRARLAGRPGTRPIDPLAVARIAALGKASAVVGAPLAGIYAGLLIRAAQLSSAAAVGDLRSAALGVASGLLVCGSGIAIERTCRVRHPPPSGEA